jgi:hypothetical protein
VSRTGRIALLWVGAVVGLILGFPIACWEAECIDPDAICSGCDNLPGMTVESGRSYVGPVLISIVLGLAVGWLVGSAISRLRARGA